MVSFEYIKPASLDSLIADMAEVQSEGAVLAGGTDLIVKMRSGIEPRRVVFDVNDLAEMTGIYAEGDCLRIGAATRVGEIYNSPLVQTSVPMLALAAGQLGSPQIRNRATLGGNILTASPAADTVPPLMAAGASVKVRNLDGARDIPIADFMEGPGKTGIREDEVMTHVIVPKLGAGCRSHFYKVGRRRALSISIVNLAGWITTGSGGMIEDVRVVLGAVAPTAIRAFETETFLKRKVLNPEVIASAAKTAAAESRPILDIRGTEESRRLLVEAWTRRLLQTLSGEYRVPGRE